MAISIADIAVANTNGTRKFLTDGLSTVKQLLLMEQEN